MQKNIEINESKESTFETKCKIAVAYDEAFHFYYNYNLDQLRRNGAELVYFSPMNDSRLPEVDGVYIGGGYPEVYAEALEKNITMKDSIREFAEKGGPIYGECGGLMYLSKKIIDLNENQYEMLNILSGTATMSNKLNALGYVFAELIDDSILGLKGQVMKGHQFRYSSMSFDSDPEVKYDLIRKRDKKVFHEGYSYKNVIASYMHAHWGDTPEVAASFVESCIKYKKENI